MNKLKILCILVISLNITQTHADTAYTKYGDIGQIAIPVLAGGITLFKKDWDGAKQFSIDVAATLALAHGVKFIVNSKRPHGGSRSFPSAHSAGAFVGAAYLHRRYGIMMGAPAYLASIFVGHSRIVARAHWAIDVIGAGVIAIGMSFLIVKPYKNLKMDLVPTTDGEGLALNASYKFA